MLQASSTFRLSSDKPRLIYVKHVEQRDPKLAALLDTIRAEGRVSYRAFQDAEELRRPAPCWSRRCAPGANLE